MFGARRLRGRARAPLPLSLALLALLASTARAQDGTRPGDWRAPLVVPGLPFVHASTTVGRSSAAARYSAKPEVSEAGPEVVYRVAVALPGRLSASVEGDAGPIDIDVHLLSSLELDAAGLATACLARGNRAAEARVSAGTYHVVVDTYEGRQRAGAYRLRIDLQPDDGWYARPVAEGVTLRTRRYAALHGGVQTGSVLDVDVDAPGVVVKPLVAQGCVLTSTLARRAGCVAAINGGFFDMSGGCRSVSLAKVDGELRATNAKTRSAIGIGAEGRPRIALVEAGRDWPDVQHALGGVGRLLHGLAGAVATPADEGSGGAFATARHPRTAVGITADGDLVLATVDGRTAAGAGMSLPDLAEWMTSLGCKDALNLDGGGSTTLWTITEGVVNHPSDNRQPDHAGERPVGTALGVWARPLDREALWLAAPTAVERVARGAAWASEVVAADPEGAAVTFRLEGEVPASLLIVDRGDGSARLTWVGDGTPRTVTLVAVVAGSRPVTRTITLRP